jgi:hypothetical protein
VWARGIVGIVLCLVGAVWVAQGTGAMRGSGMSGHGEYAVLGVVVIVIGLALLGWANHVRRSRMKRTA